MKKIFLPAAAAMCLLLTACALPEKQEELSDEEVVTTFVEAFCRGDYEGMKPYIDEDNPLHRFFAGMEEETGGEMAPVYRAYYEKLQTVTCAAQAVEGEETWGSVDAAVTAPDYTSVLHTAMAEAIAEEVETGSSAFSDVPGWMRKALEEEPETREETFRLHVGSRDGEMVMDTNTNREFFAALCGGLKAYLNVSMTTCTFLDGTVWELAAQGDEIIGLVRTETLPGASQYDPEDLEMAIASFEAPYESVEGIYAHGEIQEDLIKSWLGVDLETASSFTLVQMGLLSKQITAGSQGWLSLDSTISGFTREGATCKSVNFKTAQPET